LTVFLEQPTIAAFQKDGESKKTKGNNKTNSCELLRDITLKKEH